jgi:ABC-type lipoprotein export system ATPase subunit
MMWFVCVIVSKQNLVTATNIKKNIKIARARERERQRERQRDRERETEKECEIRDFMHYLP